MKKRVNKLFALLLTASVIGTSFGGNSVSAATSLLGGNGRVISSGTSVLGGNGRVISSGSSVIGGSSSGTTNTSSSSSYSNLGYVSSSGSYSFSISGRKYVSSSSKLYLYIPNGTIQGTVYATPQVNGGRSTNFSFSNISSKYITIDLGSLSSGYYSIRMSVYAISTSGSNVYYHF